MSDFTMIQNEIAKDPIISAAPVAQRWLLIVIMLNCAYTKTTKDDHGVKIDLEPGQFLCTTRQLAELANIKKNDVERGIARFSKAKILRQEVRHKKTVITVLWGIFRDKRETKSEPKVRQERDTKEYSNKLICLKEANLAIRKEKKIAAPFAALTAEPPLSNEREENLAALSAYLEFNKINIARRTLEIWISKFSINRVKDNISVLIRRIHEMKNPIKDHERWMEIALKHNYAREERNCEINKQFAETYALEKGWNTLKITKKYCRDEATGNDFQYKLEPKQFEDMLRNAYALIEDIM